MDTNQALLSIMHQKSVKSPLIKVALFCGLFLPLTVSLGFWQLDRAADKAHRLSKQIENSTRPAKNIDSHNLENFVHYKLRGEYSPDSYLLDNRTRDGKVGYEVLTWLSLDSGESVLVNRGWLEAGRYRTDIPETSPPKGVVVLNAYFYRADKATPVLRDDMGYTSELWPRRIQSIDWEKLQSGGRENTVVGQFRLADDQQAGAYLTARPSIGITPSKHTGYAVQWFALSITLVLLSIVACWRIIKDARTAKLDPHYTPHE